MSKKVSKFSNIKFRVRVRFRVKVRIRVRFRVSLGLGLGLGLGLRFQKIKFSCLSFAGGLAWLGCGEWRRWGNVD